MHEPRPRDDPGPSAGAIATQRPEDPLDDWLGDISDDDWSESRTEVAARRLATPADQELPVPAEDVWRDPPADLPTGRLGADDARRKAVVERRRLVAGLVVVVVLALGVVIPVVLLRDDGQDPVAPVVEATSTIPDRTETRPSSTTSATTRSATPSSTTTSTSAGPAFSLPEGTKLQRGEGDPEAVTDLEATTDPEVVTELQEALSSAGYDPGPADGDYGRRTEAAVVAFQRANGLATDGVVGPETASALNRVLARG